MFWWPDARQKDEEAVITSVHTAFFIALCGGLLMSAAGFFGAPVIASLMRVPDDIIAETVRYLRIYFLERTAVCLLCIWGGGIPGFR